MCKWSYEYIDVKHIIIMNHFETNNASHGSNGDMSKHRDFFDIPK